MTAMIAVGAGDRYHDGIYPTHVVWLSENGRPAWVLRPTGRDIGGSVAGELEGEEQPTWATEEVIWVPHDPDSILEDGLLLIACRVLCDEAVLASAKGLAPELAAAKRVELEKLDGASLSDLRDLGAQTELDYKLCVMVLGGSSLESQLPLLERYPMQLEVCTVTYSRTWGGFVGRDEAEAHGSLRASWSSEGPTPDRYHDVSQTSTLPGSLVLDQAAIDEMRPEPVDVSTPAPMAIDEIIRKLTAGPLTMGGPGDGWVVQGLINTSEGYVHLEILDPVYWGNGPALPAEHLQTAKQLGFEPAEGTWILHVPGTGEESLRRAAELLEAYMRRAWK